VGYVIIVGIDTAADPASEAVRCATTGAWIIDSADLRRYGDGLLAVSNGYVVGAYLITHHRVMPNGGTQFDLAESSRLAFLIGRPSPVIAPPGQTRAHVIESSALWRPSIATDELAMARLCRRTADRTARRRVLDPDRPRIAGDFS
jgi:delta 1-pyrroline-5-carboxylate dehydrogenase